MYLVFDTETTGLPRDWNAPLSDLDNWPRVVQVAWQLHAADGSLVEACDFLVQPDGFNIPFGAEDIHGISTELARTEGLPAAEVMAKLRDALARAEFMVGHNLKFDLNALGAEFLRLGWDESWITKPVLDTMTPQTAALVGIPGRGGFKPAKLGELHAKLFGQAFAEAHNATADVEATARCFWELVRIRHWQPAQLGVQPDQLEAFIASHPNMVSPVGLKHRNLKQASAALRAAASAAPATPDLPETPSAVQGLDSDVPFFHLHVHSQFSVLQATTKVPDLIKRAAADGQPAVALTDLGNMMGAFQFVQGVQTYNKNRPEGTPELKAIGGMDAYLCRNHLDRSQ